MNGQEQDRGPRGAAVAAVAALVAVQLKIATFVGGLGLWRSVEGGFWETFSPETTYLIFTAILLPIGALAMSRHPPSWQAPLASAGRLVAMAGAGVAIQWLVFYDLMVRFDGYAPHEARAIATGAMPRNFIGWLILLGVTALVIGALRADQERARQERQRFDLDREIAARASAALRRSIHPRFLAEKLRDLARAIGEGDGGEVLVHRIARHVRLLQREGADDTRLVTELNLFGTIDRLSSLRFDVTLPDELRDVRVAKGLAAALAELAVRQTETRELRVQASRLAGDRVGVELTMAGDPSVLATLRGMLEDDRELARTATIEQRGARLLVIYQTLAATDAPVDRPPPLPPRSFARWLPLAIVLVVGVRVFFATGGSPLLDGARKTAVILWLVAGAPLLSAIVGRFRMTFVPGLIAAMGVSTIVAAAVSAGALELFARLAGIPAVLAGGYSPWLSLPRDSATIGTAVAISALLGNHVRHNTWERARSLRLETLLSRADLVALEARFHPHFLFNALNAVLALLYEDRAAAQRMAAGLAALFEDVAIGDAMQEWPLRREWTFTARYLDVMGVRFGDRLRVSMDIPRGLDDVRMPRLVLQPLVENAIRHGIAQRTEPGTITVSAARAGTDRVLIAVENDVARDVVLPPVKRGGLSYSSDRLTLLHGADSTPDYVAGAGRFRVQFTIPYVKFPARPSRPQIDPAPPDSGG